MAAPARPTARTTGRPAPRPVTRPAPAAAPTPAPNKQLICARAAAAIQDVEKWQDAASLSGLLARMAAAWRGANGLSSEQTKKGMMHLEREMVRHTRGYLDSR